MSNDNNDINININLKITKKHLTTALIAVVVATSIILVFMPVEQASSSHTPDDVMCTGCVGNTDIASSAVTNSKIGSGAVTNSKIAFNSVTTSKIASGGVTNSDLASNAVTSAKIADDAVTGPKLGSGITSVSKATGPSSTITLSPTLQDIVSTSVTINNDSNIALILDMLITSGGLTLQSGTVQIATSSTGSASLSVVGGDTVSWTEGKDVPPHFIISATGVSSGGELITITIRANETSPPGPTDTFVPENGTHIIALALPA